MQRNPASNSMQTPEPTPLKCFRIFPERASGLYYQIRIYATVDDLRRAGRQLFNSPAGHALGWCGPFSVQAFPKKSDPYIRKICGQILFARRHLTSRIISHECCHAAFGYARRRKVLFSDEPNQRASSRIVSGGEERYCTIQGELTRQVVAKCYQFRFLTEVTTLAVSQKRRP